MFEPSAVKPTQLMHRHLDLNNEGNTTEREFLSRSNRNENPDSYGNSFSRLSSAW